MPACRQGLEELNCFIESDGPFDGILAFSQGAQVAATYLAWKAAKDPLHQQLRPVFKCAVFLSGAVPADPTALWQDELRTLDPTVDGQVIGIPTVNVWGSKDPRKDSAILLSRLCKPQFATNVTHGGEHVVPGAGDTVGLSLTVAAIRKTVERVQFMA